MDEVKRLCTSVLMMKNGIIIDEGAPDELIKNMVEENLRRKFF